MPKTTKQAIDPENPPITAEGLRRGKKFSELFPHLDPSTITMKRVGRGPQKTPTKKQLTVRLSRDVHEALIATGPGWNGRIDDLLRRQLKLNTHRG